ncbi:recombinase family protein [Pseudomonas sp. SG20052]|uniref:recombinase family protein n=1 Tax=Pseudomonas sp. SG20052 TaxID=3074147 RepID=UPI00287F723C|nr:recombinase family protein [Pseudomonas sp. SG20052]WNF55799.1 recombinase family protein [Pseudomonas sp. SG20052]
MSGNVYSYMRWSTDRQSDGSTEARQRAAQEAFCKHYDMTLVEEIADPGMSSFRGKNAHEGKLREFINRAKRGEIPPGSLLLFENADRMSRMQLAHAVPLFFEILGAGLRIGIADRLQVYTPGTLDLGGLMTILVDMERANAESKRKSDFGRAGWAKAHVRMEAGEVTTDKVAQWLEVEGKGTERRFKVKEDIAKQIRALFTASLQYGVAESCRRVNEQYGSSWKIHQVQYFLKNRRLIGEHTITNYSESAGKNMPSDRVLTDYYPVVVDKNLFAEVQAVISQRKPFAGKQDASNLNIYRGLVKCAACGGSVRFMFKTKKEYFMCTNSMSNSCAGPGIRSIRGEHLRRLLFKFEHWADLRQYFMQSSEDLKTLRRERDALLALIDKIATRTTQTQQRLMDEDDTDRQSVLLDMLTKAKGDDREARAKLATAETQLSELEDAFTIAGLDVGNRVEWMLNDRSEAAALERARINRYLSNVFEKLVIDFEAKTLSTVVKSALKGKVTEFQATITSPPDRRFTTPTGPVRIAGKSQRVPGAAGEVFTPEELEALKDVTWETPVQLVPSKLGG